ncbi:molybdopterin biosynthesis protein [bacterium]|nr:molybdopterin biosynthesis protein [bacterium]NCT19792.1 molybdopterin biosynthesis protein [bacterium]OIO85498.1 MAG: molybdopterin biosynthesis protein [Anaerolineae bacterium CG2_30_57_67]
MSLYLHDIPLPQAQERLQTALRDADLWRTLGAEEIPLDENALGRITAEPVWAIKSSPHYHASAMDGFAVRAEATAGALPSAPRTLVVEAEAKYLDTGDPLPAWANAVIPIENVESLAENGQIAADVRHPASIRTRASIVPWSHVRPIGEDIVATQLVLPAGHPLGPYDLGAIAAAGHVTVRVARRPRVAILPTGTELVPIGAELRSGDILEYNSLVMAAQVRAMGAEPLRFPITIDDFDQICARVAEAARTCDLILLNAGSSAGAEDFSSRVVEKLGQLLVHGVAVRPGHPVILGMINRPDGALPIVGVPGYPVSAALTVDIFVEPLIARWLGRRPAELPLAQAVFTRKTASPAGDDDFVRVVAGRVGEKLLAAPLSRGAGVITSLVRADGLVVIPSGAQGVEAGETVQVRLMRPASDLERTIFCIGSHDVILDLLAQFLSERGRRLVSANVGSQGGLVALKRGEAHLAGSHLLDPATGEYNLAAIRRYLPGVPVQVMALVRREQGLMVQPGNPKAIASLQDLLRPDVTFINRQRGAGTRVLLDYQLEKLGIAAEAVRGYADEEYTHLGVAAAVAGARADCGMGIPAAAQALGLDFVPLYHERYDLVIPKIHAASDLLAPLFDLLKLQSFQNAVAALPGYDIGVMGTLIAEIN